MIFENVRHRDQIDVFVTGKQVHDRLRTAAAATDEAGFQPIFRRSAAGQRHRRRRGEESTTGIRIRRLHMRASYNTARSMAHCSEPYVLSFVIARLSDHTGTPTRHSRYPTACRT